MPSSSGRSGRAKARRAPDRAQPPNSANTPASPTPKADSEDATPAVAAPAGGSGSGRRSRRRRGRRSRVRNRRTAQQPSPGANSATSGRGRAQQAAQRSAGRTAQRSSRRRGGAQQPSGQVRRPRRMRTVRETSAGGLVVDFATSRAALIGRLDRRGKLLWSLPKGHIEAGETAEQAAVREVAEETGIDSAVMATLGSIEYWFVAEDRRVHKTVHHYLLRAVGGQLSDEDVEVTEVAWVALPDLQARLAYADERRLVRRAAQLLAESA